MKTSTSNDDLMIANLAYITVLISRYGILVLVALGTVGNTLNLIIFCQRKLRTNPCIVYLLTGACVDLVLTLTIALPRMLTTYNLDYSAIISILCKMRHFAYFTLSSLSVWMITFATFDRFLISSPKPIIRQMSSPRNAYRLIVFSSILLALIFGDLFYCADVVSNGVITSCSSSTSKQCGFYNQIARLLTVLCIPETLILVFGISIARNLKYLMAITNITPLTESHQYRFRKIDRELLKVSISTPCFS